MRYLTNSEVARVVGGAAVTGWVPANWPATARHLRIDSTIATRPVRIPGLIPGPIYTPPVGSVPAAHGSASMWEC